MGYLFRQQRFEGFQANIGHGNVTYLGFPSPGRGGVLPYMGYIGMCRCEGYGFQAVYSSIGYINQSIWVQYRVSPFTKLKKPGIATQKYKKLNWQY